MKSLFSPRARRRAAWVLLELLVLTGAVVLSALANTSSSVRKVSPGTCYCNCVGANSYAGCSRMCELPKYASRWWAVTCAKTRSNAPAENPGAGPHFPHPGRAERASR